MKKIRSLRHKLTTIILSASLLTIGLFAVISQIRLRGSIRANLDLQMQSGLDKADQCLNMVLDKYNSILYDLCTDDAAIHLVEQINRGQDDMGVNSSSLRRELSHICNRSNGIKGIIVETAEGKQIFYDSLSHSSIKSPWMDQVEIPRLEKREQYHWLEKPVVLGNEEVYLFQISRRLVDYEDIHREIATAVILIDADRIRSAVESGPGVHVYLCDGDTIINAPDPEDQGKPVSFLYNSNALTGMALNELSGWTILRTQSLGPYHRTVAEQTAFQLTMALGTVAVLILIVHLTSRPIIRSVDTVVHAMNRAETGDFKVQIPLDDTMSEEVRRIALGFNRMIGQIDLLLGRIRQALTDQKNAELSALEAQIDPHFLYNTLDTINWKAIEEEQYEISEMVGALADILRYAVRDAGAETTIRQEISWLDQYMLLQSARLGKKLEQDIRVTDEAANCRIHKLLLQPFVENAIKHGLAKKRGACVIRISMEVTGEQLHITIEDNGRGMSRETLKRLNREGGEDGNHLGIANVRKRLKLYYSDEAGLYFESKPDRYTRVHLFIPVRKENGHEDSDR